MGFENPSAESPEQKKARLTEELAVLQRQLTEVEKQADIARQSGGIEGAASKGAFEDVESIKEAIEKKKREIQGL